MSFVRDAAKSTPVTAEEIKQRVSAAEVRAGNLACCYLLCPLLGASKGKQMLPGRFRSCTLSAQAEASARAQRAEE